MKIYSKTTNPIFSADTHFFHEAMIKYQNRGIDGKLFKDKFEMNEVLINNWNNKINKDDEVYFIGDFANYKIKDIKYILSRLNGNISFILGNHDKYKDFSNLDVRILSPITTLMVLDSDLNTINSKGNVINGHQEIVLSHYPILSWVKKIHGSWHLHGHTHSMLYNNPIINQIYYSGKVMDVGVDNTNLTPISYLEIKELMRDKLIQNDFQ